MRMFCLVLFTATVTCLPLTAMSAADSALNAPSNHGYALNSPLPINPETAPAGNVTASVSGYAPTQSAATRVETGTLSATAEQNADDELAAPATTVVQNP